MNEGYLNDNIQKCNNNTFLIGIAFMNITLILFVSIMQNLTYQSAAMFHPHADEHADELMMSV